MSFAFTEEQRMIADVAREFFTANATSAHTRAAMAGREMTETSGASRISEARGGRGIDWALWRRFCQDLALGGVLISPQYGGAGLGHGELAIVAEAAGARVAALPLLGLAMASRALAVGGSTVQQSHWLPKLASGAAIAAVVQTPRSETSDIKFENGHLSGCVRFVPHGQIADIFIVAGTQGAWLVAADAAGLSVESPLTMDATRPLATVRLERVVAEPLPQGPAALAAARQTGCLCLAAEALGGAQECLDRTVIYAQQREQFGRAIGSFQAYKHRLADMMVAIEQARSAVYWAACALDENSEDMALAIHAAKAFCADSYFKCAADMIQLHGGIAFTWEHDAHLFFKRARSIQTMLGDGTWHREQIAAMILGDSR